MFESVSFALVDLGVSVCCIISYLGNICICICCLLWSITAGGLRTARKEESRGTPEAFSQLVFQSRYTIINQEREVQGCGCHFSTIVCLSVS